VRESWDSEDEEAGATPTDKAVVAAQAADSTTSPHKQQAQKEDHTVASTESDLDAVVDKLDKLSV
jgi:hypothetical protein